MMTPRRIHLIGSTGSGKTYVAGVLAERLGIPRYDLDDIYWDREALTYGRRADPTLRDNALAKIVANDAWIIEGVYHQWVVPSFERADVILALTPPALLRDWRIAKRFLLRKLGLLSGKHETLRDLWSLLRWNHAYDRDSYPRAKALIEAQQRKIIVCESIADVFAAVGLSTTR